MAVGSPAPESCNQNKSGAARFPDPANSQEIVEAASWPGDGHLVVDGSQTPHFDRKSTHLTKIPQIPKSIFTAPASKQSIGASQTGRIRQLNLHETARHPKKEI